MPRMPTVDDLGPRQTPAPSRAVVSMPDEPAVPLAEMGDVAVQVAERQFTRQDAVSRSRIKNEMQRRAQEELQRLETEGDLTDDQTVAGFGRFLTANRDELIATHKGSADSRAALMTTLEDMRAVYAGEIGGRSLVAQRKLVTDTLEQSLSSISSLAYEDPAGFDERVAQWQSEISEMSGAVNSAEQRAYEAGGLSQLAKSTVEGLLDRGDLAAASEFIGRPDVAQAMTPAEMRQVRSRMTVQRITEEREANAFKRQIASIEQVVGPLSQQDRRALAGLVPAKRGPLSLAEKIAEIEALTGKPVTDEQIYKMGGADVGAGDSAFGNSMHGRALAIVEDLAPLFGQGLTSEDQERRLAGAITALQAKDAVTGAQFATPPAFLAEAIVARGLDPQQVFSGQQSIVGAFGEAPATADAAPSPVPNSADIFNRAELITGPAAVVGSAATKVPALGNFAPETASDMARAQQETKLAQQELVRVLMQNPRYAEGERQAIIREINIEGSFFDNPKAYQNRLIALDDALRRRLDTAMQTSKSLDVSREERSHAMNIANGVQAFIQQLGVPPLVNSPAELKALMESGQIVPGQSFRIPGGGLKIAPKGQSDG